MTASSKAGQKTHDKPNKPPQNPPGLAFKLVF